jgi:hypothetical protein
MPGIAVTEWKWLKTRKLSCRDFGPLPMIAVPADPYKKCILHANTNSCIVE